MEIIDREAARALGLSRFFTGEPCRHGHVATRTVTRNVCTECIRIKNRTRNGEGAVAKVYTWDGIDRRVRRLYWQAINAARVRGIPFNLTQAELLALWDRADGKCEFSGVEFREESVAGVRPFYPSLDRRDAARGYTFDNCRFVCVVANLALRDFGDAVLDEICRARAAR